MNAEFNWWLLIVGLVIGGGLVYLVLADASRRESDVLADELPREATWIAASMQSEGRSVDPPTAERVLELHRAYLASPPPDEEDEEPEPDEPPAEPAEAAERGSGFRDDADVERDAPEPEPAHRDVDEPR